MLIIMVPIVVRSVVPIIDRMIPVIIISFFALTLALRWIPVITILAFGFFAFSLLPLVGIPIIMMMMMMLLSLPFALFTFLSILALFAFLAFSLAFGRMVPIILIVVMVRMMPIIFYDVPVVTSMIPIVMRCRMPRIYNVMIPIVVIMMELSFFTSTNENRMER